MPVLEYTEISEKIHKKKKNWPTVIASIVLMIALAVGSVIVFKDKLFPLDGGMKEEPAAGQETVHTSPETVPDPVVSPEPDKSGDADTLPEIPEEEQKYLLLASTSNPLADGYTPIDLVKIPNSVYKMNRMAGEALATLLADMKSTGISGMEVKSAYRTYEKQKQLYENKVNKYASQYATLKEAETAAAKIVAYPGTSEHQTGLAADVANTSSLEESFGDTEAGKWLAAHCAEYGFIIRYPKDKTDITGIVYEPWHLRYVGKTAAKYISDHNLCLEEFLDMLQPTVN